MARISTDMGAYKEHLLLRQGDDFSFTFTVKIESEPVEFTDCTALLQVRKLFADDEPGKAALLELTETSGITLGASDGVISLRLTETQTQEFVRENQRARYQLRITDTTTGISATVLRGEIRTERSVIG
jgi:hypothetical protein